MSSAGDPEFRYSEIQNSECNVQREKNSSWSGKENIAL
jgi:hypothetical protein